jgi:tetratricopeptide (TPR) repeat protein
MPSTAELQQQAIEHAKAGNFGEDALAANLELTRLDPRNEGAWTRLARCYLEGGRLDDATAALDSVLQLNPQNTIARNLQSEVTKQRVGFTATAAPRPRSRSASGRSARQAAAERQDAAAGFGRAEFIALGQLPPETAAEALGGRIESLLMAVNERPFAAKVVEARNRAGQSGSRLFRRNSFYPGSSGHLFAFHHGGRWEPQINLGFFAAPQWGRDSVRAGIGFNLSSTGADAERDAGQERTLVYFERFQQLVSSAWRQLLTDWMAAQGGFIQHGDHPPSTDLLPKDAVGWLINNRNPREVGWIFAGRWLFADRPEDAETMKDAGKLARWIDQTFTDLLPLWTSVYRGA